jgi:choline dehydrogenase-like flavoprotein
MPDEEVLEEGVLNPIKPEVQDPLLRALLTDEPAPAATPADVPLEKSQAIAPAADEVDCVVIGLGAGGAPLLARLAMAGLKVVALEAGPWHNPEKDFATDEKAQDFLFWNDERLSAGHDPLAMGKNNSGTGVGGSTLHYTAYTPRPLPDDLTLQRDFGKGEDWPVSYQELEPYYEELEQFLGISGPTPYPWGPTRRKGYPLAPLPLNSAAQLMVRGAERVGIRTSPAANAALSGRYYQEGIGWREACTNRGFCQAGCSNGAKASMDVTFIPLAVKHGADIQPNSFVTEIERDARGYITGVVYTQNGEQKRQRCRHLFLCAGSVETPRLLLLNDLALTSGQVGKNLMAHPGLQVFGTFAEAVRPNKGIPGGLISQDTHRPKDADFAGGYLLQSIGIMPVTFAGQVARGRKYWGQQLRDYMRSYNHIAGINILGDCLPHADNFLELAEEKDARGLPKPRLHFTAQENEQRMNAHAEKVMRSIWEAAGATDIWAFQRYAHVIGTARMGRSGDDAVVDANGRAFDVPNLYISDNSTFPSALSVNPALTIMALSLRTADKFLEQQQRREG